MQPVDQPEGRPPRVAYTRQMPWDVPNTDWFKEAQRTWGKIFFKGEVNERYIVYKKDKKNSWKDNFLYKGTYKKIRNQPFVGWQHLLEDIEYPDGTKEESKIVYDASFSELGTELFRKISESDREKSPGKNSTSDTGGAGAGAAATAPSVTRRNRKNRRVSRKQRKN